MSKVLSVFSIAVLVIAGIAAQTPVPNVQNRDEAKVGKYTLPDPLISSNGTRIKNAKQWNRLRRPEIFELFETNMFGKSPARPLNMKIETAVPLTRPLSPSAPK